MSARQRRALAAVLGRLLLQDLHVAEALLEQGLRAAHPPRRRPRRRAGRSPIRTATPAATPIATCWSSAPARPALRGARGRPQRRRVILCDEQAELGGSLLSEPDADDRRHAGIGLARRRHGRRWRRWRTSRCCRARRPSATTTRISSGSAERVTDHLAVAPAGRAARAAVAGAGQAGRARHRRDRAAAGVRRQRPARASCWRARRAPISTATASRSATGSSSSPRTTAPRPPRSISPQAGVDVAAIVDLRADRAAMPWRRAPPRRASRSLVGHTVTDTGGRLRVASVRVNPVRPAAWSAPAQTIACDALLMSGGWTPSRPPVLAVARQARLATTSARCSCPASPRAGVPLGRRLQRPLRAAGSA